MSDGFTRLAVISYPWIRSSSHCSVSLPPKRTLSWLNLHPQALRHTTRIQHASQINSDYPLILLTLPPDVFSAALHACYPIPQAVDVSLMLDLHPWITSAPRHMTRGSVVIPTSLAAETVVIGMDAHASTKRAVKGLARGNCRYG